MQLIHDGQLDIATGRSRTTLTWKNTSILWSQLVEKLSTTHRTAESYNEYLSSKKPRQDEIKDIGGFVGGYLANGRRKSGSVSHRQLLTLDIDHAGAGSDLWGDFTLLYDCAACVYSTHKHSPDTPRLRLVLPLDREVMADEYVAIARRLASRLGIENFDHTTYQPERLMYWPSTSKDAEFLFQYQDGPWLSADSLLSTYHDWRDSSEWPVSERENGIAVRAIKKQGDPLEKPGIVGTFCRTHTISSVIDKYLADVYEPCDVDDRYTYKEGSTAAGLVVYDDKYAYSHHGTDPTCGKLCNAFDLVRLHKFGLKDEDAREGTPINKLPSYVAMVDLASSDREVRALTTQESIQAAKLDFSEVVTEESGEEVEIDTDWMGEIKRDKKRIKNTIDNAVIIMRNDPLFKGRVGFNLFSQREIVLKDLPWRKIRNGGKEFNDADESNLRHYLERVYNLSGKEKINDALAIAIRDNSFHPVKDYLKSLPAWDGVPRVDSLFIDYLGAEDSAYTREVTRKALVAAVARVYDPGVKFDNMPVLVGPQGIGKSTVLDRLGGQWFTDSFNFHMLKGDSKRGEEQIQGAWLVEIGELAGIGKADLESAKSFISRREDKYRAAYGKRTSFYPRQCVFFGTTNNDEFLRDATGNRRFWPIPTNAEAATKNLFTGLHAGEVGQIWAEALVLYKKGEPLFLDDEISSVAVDIQEAHTESDERVGMILHYLDILLPENWSEMGLWERRNWINSEGENDIQPAGVKPRNIACAAEIWIELFGGTIKDISRQNTKFINDVLRKAKGWRIAKSNRKFDFCGLQRAFERINKAPEKINKTNKQ